MRVLFLFLMIGIESKYYDVVIIGCGSSGIGAAVEFISQSNLSFILLEARDRIGGRAYTDKY
jgi:monoamine oxidase